MIVHTASPVLMKENPKNPEAHIGPAVNGTRWIMEAAAKNGVKRVVVTSSVAAMMSQKVEDYPLKFDESIWSDEEKAKSDGSYNLSKLKAEKCAWEIAESSGVELATILPSFTLGDFYMHTGQSSTAIVEMIIKNKIPYLPKVFMPIVDVNDVALAHYRALVVPEAKGRRFILSRADSVFANEVGQMV